MPSPVDLLRESVRRASRTVSFQRDQVPDRRRPSSTRPSVPIASPPTNDSSRLRPSRSFPNLARFVERNKHESRSSSTSTPSPSLHLHSSPFSPGPTSPTSPSSPTLSASPPAPTSPTARGPSSVLSPLRGRPLSTASPTSHARVSSTTPQSQPLSSRFAHPARANSARPRYTPPSHRAPSSSSTESSTFPAPSPSPWAIRSHSHTPAASKPAQLKQTQPASSTFISASAPTVSSTSTSSLPPYLKPKPKSRSKSKLKLMPTPSPTPAFTSKSTSQLKHKWRPALSSASPIPAQPLSTSTISTNSSLSATTPSDSPPARATPRPMTPIPENTLPSPNKRLLRRVGSSQRICRLSLTHRHRNRNVRSSSFSDLSTTWAATGPSFLSQRSDTDDSLSWSRFFSLSSADLREHRIWKKRPSSYSCSDFEIAEEDSVVEIGARLPDRPDRSAEEDIFGRRRGDFVLKNGDSMAELMGRPLLACDIPEANPSTFDSKEKIKPQPPPSAPESHPVNLTPNYTLDEEEQTISKIARAIESSRGRLRRSANMSRAFRAVIKSGDGFERKSEIVHATLNSEESKDPSVIILLDPESCDPGNPRVEGVSTTSEESGSVEAAANANAMAQSSIGFSTSMTVKQCAATLETILRDISCKVLRSAEDDAGSQSIVRLKVTQVPGGSRRLDRKVKVMVTIREEDRIRTSVAFRKIPGLYSSRDSHMPLCSEIRERFQREWPAVVEALYIRLPKSTKNRAEVLREERCK